MTLQRKQNKKKEVVKLLDISIPSNILDVLLGYLLYYPQMDKEVATSIYYLFIKINRNLYINDIYLELKFDLILFTSELIARKNIKCNKVIEGAIETKFITEFHEELDEVLDNSHAIVHPDNFSDSDVNYIIEYINEKLMYISLYEEKDLLDHMLHKLNVNDVDNFGEFGENFKNLLQKITKGIGERVGNKNDAKLDYVYGSDSYTKSIKNTIKELNSPSNKIVTGISLHNDQLGGGWFAGNCYLYLGLMKNGKSLFLINGLKWFMKYNQHVKSKNPRLKPVALYFTLENDIIESNDRIFELFIDEDLRENKSLREFSVEEVDELYKKAGWADLPVSYAVKYRKSRSINTEDLNDIMDQMEEEGYEVKILFLDYTKRIRPVDFRNDMRIDLGNVVDELMNIAKARRIPIVTAAQINRDGVTKIEEAAKKGGANLAQLLGSGQIGESALMLENAGGSCIIYNEYNKSTNTKYLTMNFLPNRGKMNTTQTYLAHPYIKPNSIILDEDYGLKKSKSIENIGDGLASFNADTPSKTRSNRSLRKDSTISDISISNTIMEDEKNF